eukprot:CAMPEP_0195132074 /NCGR_PEP_ID=MMETSP0448-20130528/146219_1 /TAXON_ID=66468 /ORGANISM="Heterocapsa triquestra, Strain CCMP 448" /LENGTH=48 /DNA_ID= /DNA_START= /DNA_END= /DNA_ORIENTATION=
MWRRGALQRRLSTSGTVVFSYEVQMATYTAEANNLMAASFVQRQDQIE